jgi:hypothetical protein
LRLFALLLLASATAHADATVPKSFHAEECARAMRVRLDNPDTVRCFVGHFPDEAWVVVWTDADTGGVALFDAHHHKLVDRREWRQGLVYVGEPLMMDLTGDGSDEIWLVLSAMERGKEVNRLYVWDVAAGTTRTAPFPEGISRPKSSTVAGKKSD